VALLDSFKYCPRCRATLVKLDESAACGECGWRGWGASVPGAHGVCTDQTGRVLLARRAFDPWAGYWSLPGGFLEEGEEPIEGLIREVREETGLDVEPTAFIGHFIGEYDDGTVNKHILIMAWRVRRIGGHAHSADGENVELRWFAPTEIPWSHVPPLDSRVLGTVWRDLDS
jgi:ADP-ribose pyrophosphatase YjhB (NUDIX family)